MKTKVTVGELSVMGQPLLDLLATEMQASLAFHVGRFVAQLGAEVDMVERTKIAVIMKHGGKIDETTGIPSISPGDEHFEEAAAEIGAMMAEVVELDIDHLTLPFDLRLKPQILMTLGKFLSVAEA